MARDCKLTDKNISKRMKLDFRCQTNVIANSKYKNVLPTRLVRRNHKKKTKEDNFFLDCL